jgi:hypothetical protein
MTIGLPPMSASGLRGKRVDPNLAGITTKKSGALESAFIKSD